MAFSRRTRRLIRQTRAIGSGPTAVNAQIGSRMAAVRVLFLKTRRSEADLEANTHTHSGKARFCRNLGLPLITVPERKVISKSPLCRVSVVAIAVRRTRCERWTRTFDMLSAGHVRVSGSPVPITYLPAQGGSRLMDAAWQQSHPRHAAGRASGSPSKVQPHSGLQQLGNSSHHQLLPAHGHVTPKREVASSMLASLTSTDPESEITPSGNDSSIHTVEDRSR